MKNINKALIATALAALASTQLQARGDLFQTIEQNDKTEMNRILKEEKSTQRSKNDAFVHACELGKLSMAKTLLKNGANVNARNRERNTALMVASKNGNGMMVRFLMNNGAKKDLKNAQGKTAMMLAEENKHPNIIMLLNQPTSMFAEVKNKQSARHAE